MYARLHHRLADNVSDTKFTATDQSVYSFFLMESIFPFHIKKGRERISSIHMTVGRGTLLDLVEYGHPRLLQPYEIGCQKRTQGECYLVSGAMHGQLGPTSSDHSHSPKVLNCRNVGLVLLHFPLPLRLRLG